MKVDTVSEHLVSHECRELVLGQVVKDPKCVPTLLHLLLPRGLQFARGIILLSSAQSLYGDVQSVPFLFPPSQWSLSSLTVPT